MLLHPQIPSEASRLVIIYLFIYNTVHIYACIVTTTRKHRNTSIQALVFHTRRTRKLVPEPDGDDEG